jgi:hypothetical protein
MNASGKFRLRKSIGRQGAVRRFGAWLAVLALLGQTLAMLAPMPAEASAPDWMAGSLCIASGSPSSPDLPAPDSKHGAAVLHDCQACLTHHAAAAVVPPLPVLLARVTTQSDPIVPSSDAAVLSRHDPSTARPRAPPIG